MNPDEQSVITLRERGFRLTPQRLAILRILEDSGSGDTSRHLTPSEIFERALKRIPGLTEATVYRTLDFLVHNGLAMVTHIGEGRLVYEAAGHNHHHLICRDCGQAVEVEHELLESLYTRFYQQTGYTVDMSHVTFFGHCPGCAGSPVEPPGGTSEI
jgi:Fe2+ or Zn2+ uptake regulation protein